MGSGYEDSSKWSDWLWEWVTVAVILKINIEEWVFPMGKGEGHSEKRKLHRQTHGSMKGKTASAYSGHFQSICAVRACPRRTGTQLRLASGEWDDERPHEMPESEFCSGQEEVCVWARHLWPVVVRSVGLEPKEKGKKNRWRCCCGDTGKRWWSRKWVWREWDETREMWLRDIYTVEPVECNKSLAGEGILEREESRMTANAKNHGRKKHLCLGVSPNNLHSVQLMIGFQWPTVKWINVSGWGDWESITGATGIRLMMQDWRL